MSTDNKASRNVAKVVMTPDAICDMFGVGEGYSIIDASFDENHSSVHLTFTGPGFHAVNEDQEVPIISARISLDGNGNRTFNWGEYLT